MLRLLVLLGMKSAHNEKYSHGAAGGHSDMQTPSEQQDWWVTDKILVITRPSIALPCLQMAPCSRQAAHLYSSLCLSPA